MASERFEPAWGSHLMIFAGVSCSPLEVAAPAESAACQVQRRHKRCRSTRCRGTRQLTDAPGSLPLAADGSSATHPIVLVIAAGHCRNLAKHVSSVTTRTRVNGPQATAAASLLRSLFVRREAHARRRSEAPAHHQPFAIGARRRHRFGSGLRQLARARGLLARYR
jgi:hypothetical protein